MIRKRLDLSVLVSFGLMLAILLFFTILTRGNMVSSFNLKAILDQTIIVLIAGLGAIFVTAQGGADLSVGTTVGITTVSSTIVAGMVGSEWIIIPVAFAIALLQGLLNGVLVAKLRVPSFMVTLAMLIGMRGVINFIQSTADGLYYAGPLIRALRSYSLKIPILIVLLLIAYYLLAHTKFGEHCKAIGENESVAISVGIPVTKVKILTFMLSAFMASIAGFFAMAKLGGTNTTMGTNLEIDVVMAIFLGGVLVTGGYSAKISKLIIGALTLSIIKNGMILAGFTSIQVTQSTQGVLLMVILFVTLQVSKREGRGKKIAAVQTSDTSQE